MTVMQQQGSGPIAHVGHGLRRPESVLATASGDIFCSHNGYGVARLCPDGRQFILSGPTEIGGLPIVPNGIALCPDGSFLVANISDAGGLLKLDAEGVRPFHSCSDAGRPPPVNFVMLDALGKIWVTVSSTLSPRSLAYNRHTANGYVGVIENGRFRVVLEGLAYTNEIRADYENGWLYVAETMGQRISRVRLDETGLKGAPQLFAQMPRGAFVDGIELDAEGGVLAACIISSELIRIDPEGDQTVLAGERIGAWVDEVETAFDGGTMGRPHLDTSPTAILCNIASVAHFGPDLDRLVCGNLLGDRLPVIDAPAPGRVPPHWSVAVPIWGDAF